MSPTRELRAAVLLSLLGSALVLVAASRSWGAALVDQGSRLPVRAVEVTGEQLAPGLRALALVGLAGVVGLLATKRWGRTAVGAVVLACGLGIVYLALEHGSGTAVVDHLPPDVGIRQVSKVTTTGWPLTTWFGGALVAVSGALVLWRGRRWATLSAAYETPAARAPEPPSTDKAVWDALDRGEDPTS